MKNVELKAAKEENFEKIAGFYIDEFSKPPFNEDWTLKEGLRKLRLFSGYCDIWEIWFENELVGMLVVNPNQWRPGKILFGEEMAIRAGLQRKGIGVEVFEQMFRIYKEKGFEEYMGIVNRDSKSFGFHEKMGARISGDNVLMKRKL